MRVSVAVTSALFLATLTAGCGAPGAGRPRSMPSGMAGRATGLSSTPKVRTGTLHVIGFAASGSHKSFNVATRNPHLISEVAPFWYGVTATGGLRAHIDPTTLHWARRHRVAVMPLFNNAGGQYRMLLSPTARARAVQNIAFEVKRRGYEGASIDFQGLPDQAGVRDGYVAFLAKLGKRLHAMNRTLTTNIIPTRQATAAHGAYSESAIGRHVDQVILMAYDRHSDGSAPGPVAPLGWVKQGIRHALASGLRPSQLYLGIANYGYDWPKGSTHAATVSYAQIRHMHVKPIWDASAAEYHFTYTKNGTPHQVWYEGERGLVHKIQLAKNHGLYGVAIWRVGYETPSYWSTLGQAIGGRAAQPRTIESAVDWSKLHRSAKGLHPWTPTRRPRSSASGLPSGLTSRHHRSGTASVKPSA